MAVSSPSLSLPPSLPAHPPHLCLSIPYLHPHLVFPFLCSLPLPSSLTSLFGSPLSPSPNPHSHPIIGNSGTAGESGKTWWASPFGQGFLLFSSTGLGGVCLSVCLSLPLSPSLRLFTHPSPHLCPPPPLPNTAQQGQLGLSRGQRQFLRLPVGSRSCVFACQPVCPVCAPVHTRGGPRMACWVAEKGTGWLEGVTSENRVRLGADS